MPPTDAPELDTAPAPTVGTGSILGIGCVGVVIVVVIVALVVRWLTGVW